MAVLRIEDRELARASAVGLQHFDQFAARDRFIGDEVICLNQATTGARPADATECFVEDAPAGLRSGKAAGCTTLAVTTTTASADLLANPDADAVVGRLAEVRFVAGPDGVRVEALSPDR